jgi:hypothetical protein
LLGLEVHVAVDLEVELLPKVRDVHVGDEASVLGVDPMLQCRFRKTVLTEQRDGDEFTISLSEFVVGDADLDQFAHPSDAIAAAPRVRRETRDEVVPGDLLEATCVTDRTGKRRALPQGATYVEERSRDVCDGNAFAFDDPTPLEVGARVHADLLRSVKVTARNGDFDRGLRKAEAVKASGTEERSSRAWPGGLHGGQHLTVPGPWHTSESVDTSVSFDPSASRDAALDVVLSTSGGEDVVVGDDAVLLERDNRQCFVDSVHDELPSVKRTEGKSPATIARR